MNMVEVVESVLGLDPKGKTQNARLKRYEDLTRRFDPIRYGLGANCEAATVLDGLLWELSAELPAKA